MWKHSSACRLLIWLRALSPILVLVATPWAAPRDLELHDAYSLHREGLDALLLDHHFRTIDRSVPWIGAWPAPTLERQISATDTQGTLTFRDSALQRQASLHPLLGLTYRSGMVAPTLNSQGRTDLEALVMEGGGVLHAEAPDFHAWGDARISVERQSPFPHSFDGQFIEPSQEGDNSVASFTSFARFEGRMTLDTRLGRIGAGRTRQHWGPSLLYPLVLGQGTQPYSQVDWSLEWGKFRVRTLWGQLSTDGLGQFRSDSATRSLYAHRYEWAPGSWLSLGVTEALILYQTEEPIAFVPVVPLFMMKGQSLEGYANGELAFDVNLRPVDGCRLYGEFLIDDMSEPTSLFNDFWKNKWAITIGSHLSFAPLPTTQTGVVVELSRVEPWVYTQYIPNTNQALNQGIPLGQRNGPNSLSLAGAAYVATGGIAFTTGLEWVRKGIDSGSATTDVRPDSSRAKKEYLAQFRDHLLAGTTLSWTIHRHVEAWFETSWSLLDDLAPMIRQPTRLRGGVTAWL